jgi:two-component system, cell cycle sensor histidine kinase and response regulator CckA
MDKEIISGLFNNSALLLAMCLLYYTLAPSRKSGRVVLNETFSGFMLGAIGVAVMVNPWHWHQGIIFDTRSILLSISGLFFGPVPTVIAMGCTALYRLYLGGSGAVMGISVILASGLVGIAWRRWRHDALADVSLLELYGFGITVHVVMLSLMALLPGTLVIESLLRIGVPVMVIYPVATALLGKLMVSRHRHLRAEEALLKSEERFANAMDATSDGLWDWDIATDSGYFSPGYYRMLGYQSEEFTMNSQSWLNLVHPDDRERALAINLACIENKTECFEVEFRMQEKRGGWRWILGRGKAVARDGNGKALRLVGTHVDITERKIAEESLREAEERYRQVFDNSFDCIFLLEVTDDQRFKAIDINTTVEQFLGITAVEARGRYMEDILAADCRETLIANYRRCVQDRVPISYEETIDFVPGTNDFYTTLIPIADAHGRVYRIVGIAHNITTRKQAEEKVRESEQLYRQLFDLESDAIFLIDAESGAILEVNRTASSMYGYGRDELLTMKNTDMSAEPEQTRHATDSRLQLIPIRLHRKKDGEVFPVEITASHFFWNGRDVHLAAIRDVTERVRAEEERRDLMAQLSQSQKMEAVGQLAGGIAHDFNNILTVIFGYAHILLAKIDANSPLRNPMEQILLSATRAADLIKGLLAFSRKQILSTAPIDVRVVVMDMEKMLRRLVREDVVFRVVLPERALIVNADKGQLGQVLVNLVTNAVDALPHGGTLAIDVTSFTMDDQFVKVQGYGQPGNYAAITVTDNGCGMDGETAKKVFEPFFTTKEVGKGTGLGLSIVYGIIRQHNGCIGVESQEGVGTTFRVFLPLDPGEAVAVDGPRSRYPVPVTGSETILLAEDDESVRRMNALTFAEAGYRVIQAVDGEDALAKFQEYADAIDILVFDVIMPKINGKVAYDVIKASRPGMKVLFMSGYTKDVVMKGIVTDEVFFIMKPFKPYDFLNMVRNILDR